MPSRIRWGRMLAAAVLSEITVIPILLAVIAAYGFLIAPGRHAVEYQQFGQQAGYYVAPPASGLATFMIVFCMSRKLRSDFVRNGLTAGFIEVLLTAGFLFGARPADRPMYLVSFAIRIASGYLAGLAARARFRRHPAPAGVAHAEAA
jgi:hypothetical protein